MSNTSPEIISLSYYIIHHPTDWPAVRNWLKTLRCGCKRAWGLVITIPSPDPGYYTADWLKQLMAADIIKQVGFDPHPQQRFFQKPHHKVKEKDTFYADFYCYQLHPLYNQNLRLVRETVSAIRRDLRDRGHRAHR